MDRFIGVLLLIQDLLPMNLKSSMDRFIENVDDDTLNAFTDLKSSMDRFIVLNLNITQQLHMDLKSSMDRFIELLGNRKLSFDFI